MSLHMPLTLHDLLLSFVGVVGGYTLGVLQSVAADQRDRWKARNRVLYTLFQIHHEVRASNPRDVLPLFERSIRRRLGKDGENVTIPPELRSTLSSVLRQLTEPRLADLAKSFTDATQALVPIDPLLALRIAGARSIRVDSLVRDYYERISNRPDLLIDPNARRVLTAMEERTLEMACKKAMAQLDSDIREVAGSFWKFRRHCILEELKKRSSGISDDEFEKEFGQDLDEIMRTVQSTMTSAPLPPAPAG